MEEENLGPDLPIEQAETLDKKFYLADHFWELAKENIFAKTWQWIGDKKQLFSTLSNQIPVKLLPKYLDESLLLIQENEELRCLSNVCTHRGFVLAHQPTTSKKIVCGYHGRRFDLEGQFEFMPEFDEAENFPRACDHLKSYKIKNWNSFLFTSLNANQDFESIWSFIDQKVGFLPMSEFKYDPSFTNHYSINAHWAIYVENFLEGFHIPFVHATLNNVIDYGQYETICKDDVVLQIGYGKPGMDCFVLPPEHEDYGKSITAYYFWVFPNLMLNFYPWGVQFNIVQPISKDHCKVSFEHYIYNREIWERMDGRFIAEKTEREDEFVVEAVQQGLKSSSYKSGRYSPKREKGVFHFHQLIKRRFKS